MRLFFLLLIGLFCFSSCTMKYENMLKSNTAEVREFMFVGEKDDIKISLICGLREKEYILDGQATELIEFGVITFKTKGGFEIVDTIPKYTLYVGTENFSGDLELNPFDHTLVDDIGKIIDNNANVSVKFNFEDRVVETKLNLVNKNFEIDSDDVYKIISKEFEKEIKDIYFDNKFNGEVYVKIINDADDKSDDYMWYFSLITTSGGRLNVLISPYTSEILAINNNL